MNKIDKAILKYQDDFKPEFLDPFITSPTLIIDSIYISECDILRDEAMIIMDSLNSYNNSVSNWEREEDLLIIPDNSPLYSWRCGVLAINEFYKQNNLKVIDYLNEIRNSSPVKKLVNFITKDKPGSLLNNNNNLNHSIDALKEVIYNSMSDLYIDCINLLFNDLKSLNNNRKENIILTIIEESVDTIPLNTVHKSIINIISVPESTRLMALGTMLKYPATALQYFFSYFTIKNFDSPDNMNLRVLLTIISDIVKALIKEKFKFTTIEEQNSFKQNSELFINQLKNYYSLDYKESLNPLTSLKRALNIRSIKTETKHNIKKEIQGELF